MMPALLTSTSIGPSCDSTASRKWAKSARFVTSTGSAITLPPSSRAVASAVARSTSPIATFAPRFSSARAVARPMPRAAPVIATTLPFSDRGSVAMFSSSVEIRRSA